MNELKYYCDMLVAQAHTLANLHDRFYEMNESKAFDFFELTDEIELIKTAALTVKKIAVRIAKTQD